ncbi:death effector domain-containing protein isoform X2 [Narcine bancroftii]|uniref:death effector domain-containing protein isoform X2 n=1 Tax=Narcine bancroftii TaxID=1343680 RepID=UPI00383193B0
MRPTSSTCCSSCASSLVTICCPTSHSRGARLCRQIPWTNTWSRILLPTSCRGAWLLKEEQSQTNQAGCCAVVPWLLAPCDRDYTGEGLQLSGGGGRSPPSWTARRSKPVTSVCECELNTVSTRQLWKGMCSPTSRAVWRGSLNALPRPTPSSSPVTWAPSSVTSSSLSSLTWTPSGGTTSMARCLRPSRGSSSPTPSSRLWDTRPSNCWSTLTRTTTQLAGSGCCTTSCCNMDPEGDSAGSRGGRVLPRMGIPPHHSLGEGAEVRSSPS